MKTSVRFGMRCDLAADAAPADYAGKPLRIFPAEQRFFLMNGALVGIFKSRLCSYVLNRCGDFLDSYLACALIFFIGSFVQGFTGFGQALVAMPILVQVIDIRLAVPLSILNGLVITGYLSICLKKHAERQKISPLVIGCLLGVPVGIYLFKEINESIFRLILGMMLIGYGCYDLFFRNRRFAEPKTIKPVWAYIAGFGSGAISTAFSAGGPPAIIYTTLTGWSKEEMKATLSVFFLFCGLAAALAHFASGLTTTTVLSCFRTSAPAVFAGVYCGSRLSQKIHTETYIKIVLSVLILLGMMLLYGL